tara:strand:+ start:361 stop:525 length:165 start_codon:yes stop_codon:yes gene_type:complete
MEIDTDNVASTMERLLEILTERVRNLEEENEILKSRIANLREYNDLLENGDWDY